MMFKSKNLGNIAGDDSIVIFTREQVSEIAGYLNCTDEELIQEHDGVVCRNLELNTFEVTSMVAVQNDGNTQTVAVIGIDQSKFVRFLDETEQEFAEFLQAHPLFPELKFEEPPETNDEIFSQIADEYRQQNVEKSS